MGDDSEKKLEAQLGVTGPGIPGPMNSRCGVPLSKRIAEEMSSKSARMSSHLRRLQQEVSVGCHESSLAEKGVR